LCRRRRVPSPPPSSARAALDIRGAPSDVYYRGMLRLDNPGNYSTPIGAADRIDIVRGPPA
jgi:hypothetical protein